MKLFALIILACYCVTCAVTESLNNYNSDEIKSVEDSNVFNIQGISPKTLVDKPQMSGIQARNARILNEDFLNVPNLNSNNDLQSDHDIVDLNVVTSANTNKVVVQLPSQKLPSYNPFVLPPRRHYRITLLRNRKPTPSPQQISSETETLIYVLVKKNDEKEIANHLKRLQETDNVNQNHNAPEVYFIKYKENNSSNSIPKTS